MHSSQQRVKRKNFYLLNAPDGNRCSRAGTNQFSAFAETLYVRCNWIRCKRDHFVLCETERFLVRSFILFSYEHFRVGSFIYFYVLVGFFSGVNYIPLEPWETCNEDAQWWHRCFKSEYTACKKRVSVWLYQYGSGKHKSHHLQILSLK